MNTKTNPSHSPFRPAPTRRVLLTSIATLLAAHAGFANDAIFSSGAFTGDGDSGVTSAKIPAYTALANIIGGDVTVNSATFVGSGGALSGTGWDLAGVPNNFGSGGIHQALGGAQIANLFAGFQYGGNPGVATLSGLTTGQTYVATFYNQAWGLGDNRTQNVASSEGASIIYNEDALAASTLKYTFVATGPTTALNFTFANPGSGSMHFYGLSNEKVFTNSWLPAAGGTWNATTTNWSTGVVPGINPNTTGTNASFTAQAAPSTVNMGNKTVGHVEFLGTNSYTLSGGILTLKADAGGTSVLKAEAGGSHTIDAAVSLQTDMIKFGAGTIAITQPIFGGKSVTVGGGTLRFGDVNSYTDATTVDAGATLDLNGTSQSLSALNGEGTVVNDIPGTSVLTVESGKFSGNIADHTAGTGLVALTKTTNGTLMLSGANTYSGPTTVSAGTLRLQGSGGAALLKDNFLTTANPNTADLNFNLANRQTGSAATQMWTANGNTQVGNQTDVQQAAGVGGNYLLLAFGASATLNGLPLSTTNVPGPLKVNFDMFKGNPGFDPTNWTSFTMRSAGGNGFPITNSGEFGFLYRRNTGIQIFNNNGLLQDFASTTGGDSFGFYLADSAGTGSPFAGNGTRLVVTQGGGVIGSYALDTGMAANSFITFGSSGNIGGVDNLAITPVTNQVNVLNPATNVSLTAPGAALTLDGVNQTVASLTGAGGSAVNMLPFSRLTVNGTTSTTFNGTITGPLASFVKDGPSVLELGAASSYTGGTTIAAGTLLTHNASSLGTGPVSIAAGANFLPWFNAGTPILSHNFTLNGLGGNPGDGNKSAIYADGGGGGYAEYILTGSVTLAATSNIGGNNVNNQRVLGQITGPGGLTKGSGRADENSALILGNPANDYVGDTVIANGTVKLGTSQVIPDGAGKGKVVMAAGTTLDLAGNNERINNLSGLGTITSSAAVVIGAPVFFTTNADSGVSTTKTYSHRLDFGDGAPATVNGVAFDPAANSGADWTLGGATNLLPESAGAASTPTFSDAPNGTAMNLLLSDFYYNGNPATLTLTGLAPGQNYDLRLYQRQWGGDRTQLFSFNAGPSTGSFIYNQDVSATPSYLSIRYTADASGIATLSTTQLGAGTFHWYGLTNEVAAAGAPNSVLTVGDATNSTYSGAITGALKIDKVGTGTLALNGALNFDTLTVDEGRVNLGSATLNSLEIANGAIVVVTTDAAPPAPGFAPEFLAGVGTQAVPEPGTAALTLGGLASLLGLRRRKK